MKFKGEQVSFLGWIDNVWYHYKWPIIIGAFALVILFVGTFQFATREQHDVFIYVAGETGLAAADADAFMHEMEVFSSDSSGDGKKIVDMKFDKFVMVEKANGKKELYNPNEQLSATERFNLELASGECVVYILQKEFFNGNVDYFASFEETLGYVPENAIKGKGIKLSDLKAYKATMTLGYFPEDYVICLADKENRIDEDYYDGNVQFLKNLIEWNVLNN